MFEVSINNPKQYWETLNKKLGKTMSEGLVDVARLACQKAANSTFPSGTSNKTKDILLKAIYKDMNRAYITDNHAEHETGDYLLRHRNTKGRIPEGINRRGITKDDYEALRAKFQQRAGMVKAGWLQAARKLKTDSRIPVWLRKDQDLARVSIKSDIITITNEVRYASDLITDQQLKNLMENSFKGLLKKAEKMKLD